MSQGIRLKEQIAVKNHIMTNTDSMSRKASACFIIWFLFPNLNFTFQR